MLHYSVNLFYAELSKKYHCTWRSNCFYHFLFFLVPQKAAKLRREKKISAKDPESGETAGEKDVKRDEDENLNDIDFADIDNEDDLHHLIYGNDEVSYYFLFVYL